MACKILSEPKPLMNVQILLLNYRHCTGKAMQGFISAELLIKRSMKKAPESPILWRGYLPTIRPFACLTMQ